MLLILQGNRQGRLRTRPRFTSAAEATVTMPRGALSRVRRCHAPACLLRANVLPSGNSLGVLQDRAGGQVFVGQVESEGMYRTARFVVGYSHDPTIGPDVR